MATRRSPRDDLILSFRRALPHVVESPYVPEGTILILNDLHRPVLPPDDWEAWDVPKKIEWAIENGMAIVVRNVNLGS